MATTKYCRATGGIEEGGLHYWVIDYETGKNLESYITFDGFVGGEFDYDDKQVRDSPEDEIEWSNEYAAKTGVRTKGDWKYSKPKKYKNGKYWVSLSKTVKANVTVICPKDYKTLCIGAGCSLYRFYDTEKWDMGKQPFYKTPWFKKNKGNLRFQLIK